MEILISLVCGILIGVNHVAITAWIKETAPKIVKWWKEHK